VARGGGPQTQKKVCFFLSSFTYSGAALAQLRLANALARRGYHVDFVIGSVWPKGTELPIVKTLNIIYLDQPRTFRLLFPIVSFIKAERPYIIFSAEDHLNAIVTLAVLLARSDAKLSVSSRVTPYDTYPKNISSRGVVNYLKGMVLKRLNRLLWLRANAVTCVSKDMVNLYHEIFGHTKHVAVYNVIIDSEFDQKRQENLDHPWFSEKDIPIVVAAARLEPEKGLADLLTAIKIVNNDRHCRLVILGAGRIEADLRNLIDGLNLGDRVQLLGFQDNPYKFFAKSKVFALSSYSEGLPSVLVEAIACGCAVVSTDCPTGPREVLRDGRFGELVPVRSPQAMAEAILRALETRRSADELSEAVFPFTEAEVVQAHMRALGIWCSEASCHSSG